MSALAEDSRNDVASNIVALVCGLIGMISSHVSNRQKYWISSFYTLTKSLLTKSYAVPLNI
jgi:hypothetical protein